MRLFVCLVYLALEASALQAQSIAVPWVGHGRDAQHTGVSKVAANKVGHIRWQMPLDLAPVYSGDTLYAHYGSPLITRANTVIAAVKTGSADGFRIEARAAANGAVQWIETTDYSLPPHGWVPPMGITLTPKNRVCFAAGGGTIMYRDAPDAATGATGRIAFYGTVNYDADPTTFNANVKISTPITSDRYGNLFFGFKVLGATTPALQSGIARIGEDGSGSWVAATTAASDAGISQVVMNCAPAMSNDHKSFYIAVSNGGFGAGYLLRLDNQTLATLSKVRLKDVRNTTTDAILPDDGSAAPTVGPDGDVYFGVLESPFFSHHLRGWLLHFDATLSVAKPAGSFGWDDTASIVPAKAVPSYTGTSGYLVLTKYNNYVSAGGNGVNRLAVLDPNATMIDTIIPSNNTSVMNEVLTIAAPTPDAEFPNNPGAVREWCISTAVVDPVTKSVFAGCEDGVTYRWDLATNTFTESVRLTTGIGEAYTPTCIGVDGTVYAVANATLFALDP